MYASLPRGPRGNLLLGSAAAFNRDPLGFLTKCAREYGDVVRVRFLHSTVVLLSRPDHIEHVLTTHSRDFIKPVFFRSPFFRRLVGRGLLTSDGEFWRRQRRLIQPVFHRDRVNLYAETMVRRAERVLSAWGDDETRDIHQDMTRLSMEIVTDTLFGVDAPDFSETAGDIFHTLAEYFTAQTGPGWVINNWLPTPANRRFHRVARRLDALVFKIIAERRACGRLEGRDLLSMLIQARDEDGGAMTDQQLRDEVLTLLMAGHQTTALTLSWTCFLLSGHAGAAAQLRQELAEVLGGRAPETADLPRLRYTGMVVKEALRLFPPAYAVGRQAVRECVVGGYLVPAGAQLLMSQWVVQRDARHFDDPEEFRPERWAGDLEARLPKYAYFPFGGGPRQCIGGSYALTQAVLLLAAVAQQFWFEPEPGQNVELMAAMSLRPRDGIKLRVRRT